MKGAAVGNIILVILVFVVAYTIYLNKKKPIHVQTRVKMMDVNCPKCDQVNSGHELCTRCGTRLIPAVPTVISPCHKNTIKNEAQSTPLKLSHEGNSEQTVDVVIRKIEIDFWDLTAFFVYAILAMIPAGILATIIIYAFMIFFGGFFRMFAN